MYYCARCDRYFNSPRALEQHQENSGRHNICYRCDKDFESAWGLTQHFVQSPRHFYCQHCDEHFGSDSQLDEHFEEDHFYCHLCNTIFNSALGLHEHNRQKHSEKYCVPCKRLFQHANNLDAHLRSSIHQPLQYKCPGAKCGRGFVSQAARILHWESGTCPSGVTRDTVNRAAVRLDRNNVITNPARLIAGADGSYAPSSSVIRTWATERSWNGSAFECYMCHRTFAKLSALNGHLGSPAHQDKIYKCPTGWYECGTEFTTLSGLCQHVEAGNCGVKRFQREMNNVLGSLTDGMRRLTC